MKTAIFICDEGYGHAMRQKNIINELLEHIPFIHITVFTKDKIDILKDEFGNKIEYVELFNLILTVKDKEGNLDIAQTKESFKRWAKKKNEWIDFTLNRLDKDTQLIISDSVPQVSHVSEKLGIKQINIQHFTWDWLYKELYGKDSIYESLNSDYLRKGKFLFPPLTPRKNLLMYKNHIKIDFIVNRNLIKKTKYKLSHNSNTKYTILIMNNGTNSLSFMISQLLRTLPYNKKWNYLLRSDQLTFKDRQIALEREDINIITGMKNTHLAIAESNIILARGGYNILSELLALRKFSIIIEEKNNPEIISNLELANKYKNIILSTKANIKKTLEDIICNEKFIFTDNKLKELNGIYSLGASQVLLIASKLIEN